SVGAICGITSVCLVCMYGQSRIIFAMARDGLMPKIFGRIDPKRRTPAESTRNGGRRFCPPSSWRLSAR
ncbi:MAG: hypothetical protein LKI94_07915, partial [Sporolactobacillus sp.]|nr:hypothetical protein [Sporolactobacillus sp.]